MNNIELIQELIEQHASEDNRDVLLKALKKLEEDSIWVTCLEHAGVDTWGGYDYAMDLFEEFS